MTAVTKLEIGGVAYHTRFIAPLKIVRQLMGVGTASFILDNKDGALDGSFDVEHNPVEIAVDGSQFFYGHLSKIQPYAECGADRFSKYVYLEALDQAEGFTFCDDFELKYPDITQDLSDILHNLIYHYGSGRFNHISYSDVPKVANIGAYEKKEGSSLLAFLQELHRANDYLFRVEDDGALVSEHLASLTSSGVTLSRANFIGPRLDYLRQSADKLYNYIKLYSKSPMFDGYTELNAADWDGHDGATITDDSVTKKVGLYSIKATPGMGSTTYGGKLDFSGELYNYTSLNLTKGTLGCWIRFDDGSSPVKFSFYLTDTSGHTAYWKGLSTRVYTGQWGWIEAPLGRDIAAHTGDDLWTGSDDLKWEEIREIRVQIGEPLVDYPDEFWIDGLSIPLPCIAVASEGGFSTANEKRALVASRADVTTQNALQKVADKLLLHHKDGTIKQIRGTFAGDTDLRYPSTTVTVDFPNAADGSGGLGISSDTYYVTSLTHVISPRKPLIMGHEHIMEVEAVLVNDRGWDHTRLGTQPVARYNVAGIGLKEK